MPQQADSHMAQIIKCAMWDIFQMIKEVIEMNDVTDRTTSAT